VEASVLELELGARQSVANRARDQDLARPRHARYTRSNVHRQATELATRSLDLPHVEPAADLEPELTNPFSDRARAADRPHRLREGRQEAVARGVDLVAPEPLQLPPHARMMFLSKRAPALVPELGGPFRGAHDVREQDSGQQSFRLRQHRSVPGRMRPPRPRAAPPARRPGVGGVVLVPSLWYLYRVLKGKRAAFAEIEEA
jgi:hypothetical protein